MTEALRPTFVLFSQYNSWANTRLYNAAATLPHDELVADRKAFFGSIFGTLNHILVGDRAWLGRILDLDFGITNLDQTLHDDLASLRQARVETDQLIETTMASAPLDGDLTYTALTGGNQRTPRSVVFSHLFNHQTHHRGQVHQMLGEAGLEAPPLDLIYFYRQLT